MISLKKFKKKKFIIYGMGKTGQATAKALKSSKINFICWDDNDSVRKNLKKKNLPFKRFWLKKNYFNYDYIVISPGINYKKLIIKKYFIKNKNKIITDLDLFFKVVQKNKNIIAITGSNGKSTTCKLLEKIFTDGGFSAQVGGNIGLPVLSLKSSKDSIYILEVSSFQLDYSKYFSSSHAAILNISPDHLDWHFNLKNYIQAKSKIFARQNKKNFLYLNKNCDYLQVFLNKIKSSSNKPKIVMVKKDQVKKIFSKISNSYLKSESNLENASFAFSIAKNYNISKNNILKSFKNFKGLPHRQELIFSSKKIKVVNDSKATTFESSYQSINNFNKIYWIVGGLPKEKDQFRSKLIKKKIIKAYIIGNNTSYFKNQISDYMNYSICKTIKKALKEIIADIKAKKIENDCTILLSPAAASYDQYKNFEQRGNQFKNLIKKIFYNFKYA